jgi:hypothetical protein
VFKRALTVWGTLTRFTGIRKINTIGLGQANKVMHLAATACHLKKLLKFVSKQSESVAAQMPVHILLHLSLFWPEIRLFKPLCKIEQLLSGTT